jgi:hypothetical protein
MFDQQKFIEDVQQQTKAFKDIIVAQNDNALLHKAEHEWSIADILEHVIIVEKSVMLTACRLKERNSNAKNYGQDKLQRILIGLRNKPIIAPSNMQPKSIFNSKTEVIEAFTKQRNTFEDWLITGKIIVDDRTYEHPFLGVMTIEDWMYFIIQHADRHKLQILDRINLQA